MTAVQILTSFRAGSARNLMMSYRIPATLPESRLGNLQDRFGNLRLLREPVIYRARADGLGESVGART